MGIRGVFSDLCVWGNKEQDVLDKDYIRLISSDYLSVFRVNLWTYRCEEVNLYKKRNNTFKSVSGLFQGWVDRNQIYSDDIHIVDGLNIESIFNQDIRFRYRGVNSKEYKWVILKIYKISDGEALLYLKDIHDEYRTYLDSLKESDYISTHDIMTGFSNRYAYESLITSGLPSSVFGIVYIDLNGLKQVNDTLGHDRGDTYIKDFSEILSSVFRKDDCYRVGGDEFIVVCPGISNKELSKRVEHLNSMLSNSGNVSASVGFAWSNDTKDIKNTVKIAERRMYNNKALYYSEHDFS